jgi:NADPH:quinone reductase-like Zn-dependent oxidoreductase
VQFDHYGPADVLRVVDVPRPSAGDGQVLVRVAAAGINPGEIVIRNGAMEQMFPATFPSGQGSDFAGPGRRGRVRRHRVRARRRGHRLVRQSVGAGRLRRIRPAAPDGQGTRAGLDPRGRLVGDRCDVVLRGPRRGRAGVPDDLPFDQAAIIPDAVSTPQAAIVGAAQVRPAQSAGVWGFGG